MAVADSRALVAVAENPESEPEDVQAALRELLGRDPRLGAATALGLLSCEPRIKPSFGLLIDPCDSVLRRWRQRVAAGRALVGSPVLSRVLDEVGDELTESADLAFDVLGKNFDIRLTLSAILTEAPPSKL
jgi:hypothetical protein